VVLWQSKRMTQRMPRSHFNGPRRFAVRPKVSPILGVSPAGWLCHSGQTVFAPLSDVSK